MRKVLIGVAAFLAVLLIALLVAPRFVDVDRYKPRLVGMASAALGREVRIGGELSLSLLPSPHLSVADVTIANAEGFSPQPLISLRRLDVKLALLPLIRQRIEMKSLILKQPELLLETRAGGGVNWQFRAQDPSAPKAAGSGDFAVDHLEIEDGRVVYRELGGQGGQDIQDVNAIIALASPSGPYEAEMTARFNGLALDLSGESGRLGPDPAPLKLDLRLEEAQARLSLDGTIQQKETGFGLDGAVSIVGQDVSKLAAALPAGQFRIAGRLAADSGRAKLSQASLELGDSRGAMEAEALFGEAPSVNATLDIALLKLDDIIPPAKDDKPLTGPFPLSLPGDLDAVLALRLQRVEGAAMTVNDAAVKARLADGVLNLSDGRARLPGDAKLDFGGALFSRGGHAEWQGRVSLNAPELRRLLAAAKLDLGDMPAAGFNSLSWSSDLTLEGENLRLQDIDARLDDSHITGMAGYGLRVRPGYSANLKIDRLDLDKYMRAKAAPNEKPSDKPSADLDALAKVDANVKLAVGELRRGGQLFGDMALDMSLLQGALKINQASVGGPDDAQLMMKGGARDLAGAAKLDLQLVARGRGLDRLFVLAGQPAPAALARTGAFKVDGTAAGGFNDLAVDLKGAVGDLQAGVKGKFADLKEKTPRFDLVLDAQHPSLAALGEQFALTALPSQTNDAKPLKMNAKLRGTPRDFAAAGQMVAGGGSLAFTLDSKSKSEKADISATLTAKAKDLRGFIRDLGFDYNPSQAQLGALDLSLAVKGGGGTYAIDGFGGDVGPAHFNATGALDMTGEVPNVTLDIAAGALPLDSLLPPRETGAEIAAEKGGPRWSDAPLPVEVLSEIDGQVTLDADSLTLLRYEFEHLHAELESEGPRLDLKTLRGKLFGGDIAMQGGLDARATPSLNASVDMKGVPADKLLKAAAGIRPATGALNLSGAIKGQGTSEKAIVSSLEGRAAFAAESGAVNRIDLLKINQQLSNLGSVNDFLKLIGAALEGGQTAYRRIAFDMPVAKGVLKTQNFVADMDGADVDFRMTSNLPAWTIDAAASMAFKDHRGAPPIGAVIKGDFGKPAIKYQTDALKKWVLTRFGAAFLRGVTGGGAEQPAVAGENKTPAVEGAENKTAEKPKPEEQIKSLLDTLIQKKDKAEGEPKDGAP